MATVSEASDGVERWLDAFESRWLADEDAPPDIVAECRRLADRPGFEDQRVVWELAMIDLEFRWRNGEFALRRGARWYAEQLAPFGIRSSEIEDLGLHELVVRSRWADQPPVESVVAEQYPGADEHERARLCQRWREQFEVDFPVQCLIAVGPHHPFQTILRTPCVLGRQRSTDPDGLGWCEDPETGRLRLVIAEHTESTISRQQMLLRRHSVDTLEVTPLSSAVNIYWGQRRLDVERAVLLPLSPPGLDLRFGQLILRFRRA